MIAYKLFKQRKDGSLGSLLINRKIRLIAGLWIEAENHPTRGYAERFGWHCTSKPEAPHLSSKGRVWRQVEIEDFYEINRPSSQGGKWFIAKYMRILGENKMSKFYGVGWRYFGNGDFPEEGSEVTIIWNNQAETDCIWTNEGIDWNAEIIPISWKYQ